MERVTFQLKSPNPLFETWLQELKESSAGTPAEAKYNKALDSLRKYPLVLKSGSECAILKGFTATLCKLLDRKLSKHNGTSIKSPVKAKNKSPKKTPIKINHNAVEHKIVDMECDLPATLSVRNDSSDMPTVFSPGSFDIILLVDRQETNGKAKQSEVTTKGLDNFTNTKYELSHLKVGDFLWIARHRISRDELVLPYIVERKRLDDLEKSIKDGRFNEQKFRLKQCGIPKVIYLIEKHESVKSIALPISTLTQAITNTRIQNDFLTHFTASLTDSMKFLAMMTQHLTDTYSLKELRKCSKENLPVDTLSTEISLMCFKEFNLASAKSKTLDVLDLFIKQLLQLKGMSVEKALAIANCYKTPLNLMNTYKDMDEKSGESMLQSIIIDGKKCNVGPGISKAIYKYFTKENLD